MDIWVFLIIGLMAGGCIGYVLGVESPRRCIDCLSNDFNRYQAGHRAGYQDGMADAVERVRKLGHEARNTYTITKDELERIRGEAECV